MRREKSGYRNSRTGESFVEINQTAYSDFGLLQAVRLEKVPVGETKRQVSGLASRRQCGQGNARRSKNEPAACREAGPDAREK